MKNNKYNILLVEDNNPDVVLFKEILADTIYSTHRLSSVRKLQDAYKIISKENIDIIVLDLNLPDSRGLGTFEKIADYATDVPVIIYTVTDDESVALDAIRKGAEDYLIKGRNLDTVQVEKSLKKAVESNKNRQLMHKTMLSLKLTNEHLDHFAQVASHDLNAPVINLEELLKMVDFKQPTELNHALLQKMDKSLTQLRKTLNAIFKVLDYNVISDEPAVVNKLETVTQKVIASNKEIIDKKNAQVNYQFIKANEVKFPSKHLFDVINQLVTNSLKFHIKGKDPIINISSSSQNEDYICVRVEDNGIGFNDKRQSERIFNMFSQPHRNIDTKGVGLYITRTLMEKQNGYVNAKSRKDVPGSIFELYFSKK